MNPQNPLLATPLPLFDRVAPSHVESALAHCLSHARATIEKVIHPTAAPSWENLMLPLSQSQDRLETMWHVVSHLNAVVNTPAWRDAYNAGLPLLTAFHTAFWQDKRLFDRFTALKESHDFATLTPAQQMSITRALRDFRLGGVALADNKRARYKAIQEERATLSAKFDDHLLDATQDFSLPIKNEKDLAGIPEDVVAQAKKTAEDKNETGYSLTLAAPCYRAVTRYAKNRDLRATLHRAYATRASELGINPERNNAPIIDKLLSLREEEARLLDFPHYGALSLEPKMAENVDEVIAFLRDLAARARPFAVADLERLATFARDTLGLAELLPHDIAFASEKLKERDYAFSDEEVRQYFPIEKVLKGLFSLTHELYSVKVIETPANTWHADVRHFELRDDTHLLIGEIYLDPYARETKQSGAWMGTALPYRVFQNHAQRPIIYLTCNFASAVGDLPATLTHDDVTTLFHEWGHGLHQLLTNEATPGVSGMEGFEWDAVELPSQFMENFCYEQKSLTALSEHVKTKEPLPQALFDKLTQARHFQSGLFLLRQIEFALFDMLLHTRPQPLDFQKVLNEVRREIAILPVADYDRFPHTFGHIFAGGYAAGYYSYLWAEVLSSDVYSFFENDPDRRSHWGKKLRDEILGRGSARAALDSFIAFAGRKPKEDAFLRHYGLTSDRQK